MVQLTPIHDESQMPWDLPPIGNLTDFNRVILANQSVYIGFLGVFFQKSVDSLYFLHNVFNDPRLSEFTFNTLGPDANFINSEEIEKTDPIERVDMVAALPGDQVYTFTNTPNGPVVSKLKVTLRTATSDGEKVCLILMSDSKVLLNHW